MAVDIRKPLKKFLPHLLQAQADNLNEADTVQRLVKFFEDVLGYDPMTEISREGQIKDKYVDLVVKIDGAVRLLVEAKAAGTTLRDRHIEQAERYAADGNIRWILLTNGVVWHLYHLTFEEGIESQRAIAVDLSSDPPDRSAELLGLVHRQSVRAGDHEDFWQRRAAMSPESIAKALFTEEALRFIRREIRRREGLLVDEEDLAAAIHGLFSTEARERIGPLRIRRKRAARTSRSKGHSSEAAEASTPATSSEVAPAAPTSPGSQGAQDQK